MGTSGFVAPEMYHAYYNNSAYDEKVDCWSLGAVLYEVLTSETLVKGENEEEEMNPTPNWGKVKAFVPKEVSAVKSLLVIDPKQRKSSREVVELLERNL